MICKKKGKMDCIDYLLILPKICIKIKQKNCILPAKVLLESVCCWPDNTSSSRTITAWILFLNLMVAEIFHAAYVVVHASDISDAVSAGATVTTTFEALVRVHIMLSKKRVINEILSVIWKQFWPLRVILKEEARKELKMKAMISVLLPCTFLVSSVLSNLLITGLPFIKEHQLVLKSIFPFDWNQSYIYEALYVWQYVMDWYVLFMVNAFDFFFVSLVTICCIQFLIMQEVLTHILSSQSKEHRKIIFGPAGENMSDHQMLWECLKQHKLLIGICDDIEQIFNKAALIQFAVSACANCAAFLIMKVDYGQFFKMLFYAMAHLVQLFYYCYVGQQLSYESEALADAIYKCDWHLQYDRSFRKSLIMMIQRSQRRVCLTAVGFVELDFGSFIRILRMTFSFYTLLNNLLMKNEQE
uniref:Odorant receptor n=1 Tax=Protaetia brevitarsis TaxID=348688 RepID=A0A411HR58_PROBE|nr:odorant receptor [Protaetia brevitarsis]